MRIPVRLAPVLGAIMMSGLAFTLVVVIIAQSPYTHGNLRPEGYDRTEIAFVGDDLAYDGFSLADPQLALTGDRVKDGLSIFVRSGCASCHGLTGQGAAVGNEIDIEEISAKDLRTIVRFGPRGMPPFLEEILSDEEIDKLYAFLESLVGEAAAPTVTPVPTEPTVTPAPAPTATTPAPAASPQDGAGVSLQAASATITVDGDNADWAAIDGLDLTLVQFDLTGTDWDYGSLDPKSVTIKVATDGTNIYVLVEVDDTFDFVADDHKLSPALAVMFPIETAAGPHMGSGADDFEIGLGMVDIWHWELDCAAGELSGGGDPGSGDDPDCNLDDEYATDPETRKDDGGGSIDNPDGENSLAGSWSHTAGSVGGAGTWIFEMSRPLQTGDPQDAQFAAGGTALVALAYWDPKETVVGWTDAGHLVTSDAGWIQVSLPAAAAMSAPATTGPLLQHPALIEG